MSDTTELPDLDFPETLSETMDLISGLIGEVTELRAWLNLQYEGRENGLRVDWPRVKQTHDDIARIQGDIKALKKHAAPMIREEEMRVATKKAEAARLKLERAAFNRQTQVEAIAAKKDRLVLQAQKEQRRANAAHTAVMRYVKENLPDHWPTVVAVAKAVQDASQ